MIPARECFAPLLFDAPGARLRAARFAADPRVKARTVCVLLNGQTEFIEKYFEVIDELRGRGFAVAALDWRGQGGSQRQLPGLKAHIADFAEYDADLKAMMDQIVAPMLQAGQTPIALAHSMGGHVLLRYLQAHPGRIAAAACCAPMVMFSSRGLPRWMVRLVTAAMIRLGHATDFVWQRDPLTTDFGGQIVTSDPVRFQRSKDFLAQHPELRLAGPTWGWIAAAFASVARLAGMAEQIGAPVLICGAGHDLVCITAEAERFARRMPDCEFRRIADARHEILMERDVFRAQFWSAFDSFMAKRA